MSGALLEKSQLRYTPSGTPIVEFKLAHASTQQESGADRQVQCEFACLVLGQLASDFAAMAEGSEVVVKGFFAAKNRRWPSHLVLHVTDWKRPA